LRIKRLIVSPAHPRENPPPFSGTQAYIALEAISAKLKDQTDLKALSEGLVGTLRETMQPAHVSP
jgi:hypothetical protein